MAQQPLDEKGAPEAELEVLPRPPAPRWQKPCIRVVPISAVTQTGGFGGHDNATSYS